MSLSELPDWYVLKKPEKFTVDIKDLIDYANERIESFLAEDPWIISHTELLSDDEWLEIVIREIGGHLFLRVAVSTNPRLTSWLVEMEGDLFEFRFIKSLTTDETESFLERVAILRHLYGEKNVKTINELNEEFGVDIYRKFQIAEVPRRRKKIALGKKRLLSKHIGLKYYIIPNIVAEKKALLYKGWAIVQLADVRLSVKRQFEKKLKEAIENSKVLLERDPALKEIVKPVQERLLKIAQSRAISNVESIGELKGKYYQNIEYFPPCIRELVTALKTKGHLSHVENWQLGTFLKRVGMTVEEQYQFWYKSSIDNIGITFDEFVNKVGYQIRHIYGLEGGGIDYDPPSCKTCISGYFCYFAHKRLEDITEDIKERFKNYKVELVEKAIDDITRLLVHNNYQKACARFFALQTGRPFPKEAVSHMIQYVRYSARAKRYYPKKKAQENTKNE